jgi:hypothetical protein
MIDAKTFAEKWLSDTNARLGWNRSENQFKYMEKAVVALYLLEQLQLRRLDFVFKGGSEMLLLLDRVHRLSVDIDVVIEHDGSNMPVIFDAICDETNMFYRWERQERSGGAKSKTEHYRFYYKPFVGDTEHEFYILLDVYKASGLYTSTIEKPIACDLLSTSGDVVTVKMLSPECLIADKLSAFAPTTIGIPVDAEPGKRPKRVEVLKQLFDIGLLFDLAADLDLIRTTYMDVAEVEIANEGLDIAYTDTLTDSLEYAYIIGCGKASQPEIYHKLQKGYKEFRHYAIDLRFDEDDAVLAASKLAYLVALLKIGPNDTTARYSDDIDMTDWKITGEHAEILNGYKLSNQESFFYWYQASLLQ